MSQPQQQTGSVVVDLSPRGFQLLALSRSLCIYGYMHQSRASPEGPWRHFESRSFFGSRFKNAARRPTGSHAMVFPMNPNVFSVTMSRNACLTCLTAARSRDKFGKRFSLGAGSLIRPSWSGDHPPFAQFLLPCARA